MSARHHGFFYRYRTALKVFGIGLLVAAALGLAYFLSLLGPRSPSDVDLTELGYSQEAILAMVDEAEALQAQYQELARLREPTAEDIDMMRQAVAKLEDALEAAGGSDRTIRLSLESAREIYHNAAASALYKESSRLENEIKSLPGDNEEARIELYAQAIKLQEEINDSYPLSDYADARRLAKLIGERDTIRAQPVFEQSQAAGKRAEEAIEARDWEVANEALTEAIRTQKLINAEYPELQYADFRRLSRLEREFVSLRSSRYYDQVIEQKELAEKAMQEQRFREAAAAYLKAARAQENLNREYPSSRFASMVKAEEFRALQETALGTELSMEINQRLTELDRALKQREVWDASGKIQSLVQQIEQFTETYPRSTIINEEIRDKVAFLNHVQNDLALLQDRLYGQLLPVPENSNGWHMTKTEVAQALFVSIMLNNPSRNQGELFPVDSITWDEAKDFCKKVSWLLGREVRLPTKEEYLLAVGKLRYVNLDEISWNQQNSDGLTHEVGTKEANANGFFDILGNVSEWLESSDLPGDSEAYLCGGSAETSIDIMVDKPIEIVNRRTRNRMNGFRISVKLD